MSGHIRATISCDYPGCTVQFTQGGGMVTVRKAAARLGWVRHYGARFADLCPRHAIPGDDPKPEVTCVEHRFAPRPNP